MRFPQSDATIYKQWIKGSATGIFGHGKAGRPRQPVAVSLYEIRERIIWVELRIYMYFFKSGNDEGIANSFFGVDVNRHAYGLIFSSLQIVRGNLYGIWLGHVHGVLHDN